MTGKRVGIIGMGRIGTAIAKRCHYGFGMEVLFTKRSPLPDPGLPARQVSQGELLKMCDFVVIAVTASPATHQLIGPPEISKLQPHAHLIHLARGAILQ